MLVNSLIFIGILAPVCAIINTDEDGEYDGFGPYKKKKIKIS